LADCRHVSRGACCTGDTPAASLSKASRSRQTTDQHRCFVAAWLIFRKPAPRYPRRISPYPSSVWGRGYFDGSAGPRAEGKDRTFATDPIAQQGAPRRGPRSRADGPPHAVEITHRRSGFVWTKKWAFNWNTAEIVAMRTRGLKVTRFTLNELYRAERCRDLAEEYRLVAAMCASTETRDHYSRMSEHYRTLAEAEESDVETSSAFEP
jgi:hypothetical protein